MTLVIMAAGMGSRFGGLKQIEPVHENGEFILDYSIYDAIKCGFDKVVFIIKEENYDIFRDTIGKRIENIIDVSYVFQKNDNVPSFVNLPKDRVKPLGTGHAILCCKDVVKENVPKVISSLKKKNINVVMLTGDNEATAKKIAEVVGIETVVANVMPSQKAEYVEKFKKDGLVMMCGDGINDSVSLVKADIGVSVSSGTDIAMDSAQVVIMNDNLDRINDLIRISSKTIRNISGNLFWAFFYNICMIPIAMGVFVGLGVSMNPMLAALAMVFSSLFVVLNALRLRKVN